MTRISIISQLCRDGQKSEKLIRGLTKCTQFWLCMFEIYSLFMIRITETLGVACTLCSGLYDTWNCWMQLDLVLVINSGVFQFVILSC